MSKSRKHQKLYFKVCACGEQFCTVSNTVKWCRPCAKAGRNRGNKAKNLRLKVYQRRRGSMEVLAPGSHTEVEWFNVLKNQGYCCYYCGREMTERTWSRDHRTPLSRGGSDDISNIVAACRRCNSAKGSLTSSEFIFKKELNITAVEARQLTPVDMTNLELCKSKRYAVQSYVDNKVILSGSQVDVPGHDGDDKNFAQPTKLFAQPSTSFQQVFHKGCGKVENQIGGR